LFLHAFFNAATVPLVCSRNGKLVWKRGSSRMLKKACFQAHSVTQSISEWI
jgi:hypothetical protein